MPIVTADVPEGTVELMKGLAHNVIKERPSNIYSYAAEYFEALLMKRDGKLDEGYEKFGHYYGYSDYIRRLNRSQGSNSLGSAGKTSDSGIDVDSDKNSGKYRRGMRQSRLEDIRNMEVTGKAIGVHNKVTPTEKKRKPIMPKNTGRTVVRPGRPQKSQELSKSQVINPKPAAPRKTKSRKLSSRSKAENLTAIKEESFSDAVDENKLETQKMEKAAIKIQRAFKNFKKMNSNASVATSTTGTIPIESSSDGVPISGSGMTENAAALVITKAFKSLFNHIKSKKTSDGDAGGSTYSRSETVEDLTKVNLVERINTTASIEKETPPKEFEKVGDEGEDDSIVSTITVIDASQMQDVNDVSQDSLKNVVEIEENIIKDETVNQSSEISSGGDQTTIFLKKLVTDEPTKEEEKLEETSTLQSLNVSENNSAVAAEKDNLIDEKSEENNVDKETVENENSASKNVVENIDDNPLKFSTTELKSESTLPDSMDGTIQSKISDVKLQESEKIKDTSENSDAAAARVDPSDDIRVTEKIEELMESPRQVLNRGDSADVEVVQFENSNDVGKTENESTNESDQKTQFDSLTNPDTLNQTQNSLLELNEDDQIPSETVSKKIVKRSIESFPSTDLVENFNSSSMDLNPSSSNDEIQNVDSPKNNLIKISASDAKEIPTDKSENEIQNEMDDKLEEGGTNEKNDAINLDTTSDGDGRTDINDEHTESLKPGQDTMMDTKDGDKLINDEGIELDVVATEIKQVMSDIVEPITESVTSPDDSNLDEILNVGVAENKILNMTTELGNDIDTVISTAEEVVDNIKDANLSDALVDSLVEATEIEDGSQKDDSTLTDVETNVTKSIGLINDDPQIDAPENENNLGTKEILEGTRILNDFKDLSTLNDTVKLEPADDEVVKKENQDVVEESVIKIIDSSNLIKSEPGDESNDIPDDNNEAKSNENEATDLNEDEKEDDDDDEYKDEEFDQTMSEKSFILKVSEQEEVLTRDINVSPSAPELHELEDDNKEIKDTESATLESLISEGGSKEIESPVEQIILTKQHSVKSVDSSENIIEYEKLVSENESESNKISVDNVESVEQQIEIVAVDPENLEIKSVGEVNVHLSNEDQETGERVVILAKSLEEQETKDEKHLEEVQSIENSSVPEDFISNVEQTVELLPESLKEESKLQGTVNEDAVTSNDKVDEDDSLKIASATTAMNKTIALESILDEIRDQNEESVSTSPLMESGKTPDEIAEVESVDEIRIDPETQKSEDKLDGAETESISHDVHLTENVLKTACDDFVAEDPKEHNEHVLESSSVEKDTKEFKDQKESINDNLDNTKDNSHHDLISDNLGNLTVNSENEAANDSLNIGKNESVIGAEENNLVSSVVDHNTLLDDEVTSLEKDENLKNSALDKELKDSTDVEASSVKGDLKEKTNDFILESDLQIPEAASDCDVKQDPTEEVYDVLHNDSLVDENRNDSIQSVSDTHDSDLKPFKSEDTDIVEQDDTSSNLILSDETKSNETSTNEGNESVTDVVDSVILTAEEIADSIKDANLSDVLSESLKVEAPELEYASTVNDDAKDVKESIDGLIDDDPKIDDPKHENSLGTKGNLESTGILIDNVELRPNSVDDELLEVIENKKQDLLEEEEAIKNNAVDPDIKLNSNVKENMENQNDISNGSLLENVSNAEDNKSTNKNPDGSIQENESASDLKSNKTQDTSVENDNVTESNHPADSLLENKSLSNTSDSMVNDTNNDKHHSVSIEEGEAVSYVPDSNTKSDEDIDINNMNDKSVIEIGMLPNVSDENQTIHEDTGVDTSRQDRRPNDSENKHISNTPNSNITSGITAEIDENQATVIDDKNEEEDQKSTIEHKNSNEENDNTAQVDLTPVVEEECLKITVARKENEILENSVNESPDLKIETLNENDNLDTSKNIDDNSDTITTNVANEMIENSSKGTSFEEDSSNSGDIFGEELKHELTKVAKEMSVRSLSTLVEADELTVNNDEEKPNVIKDEETSGIESSKDEELMTIKNEDDNTNDLKENQAEIQQTRVPIDEHKIGLIKEEVKEECETHINEPLDSKQPESMNNSFEEKAMTQENEGNLVATEIIQASSSDLSDSDNKDQTQESSVGGPSRDEHEEGSDLENFDFSSCGEDSLEAMYYSLKKNEILLDKMHQQASDHQVDGNAESRSNLEADKEVYEESLKGSKPSSAGSDKKILEVLLESHKNIENIEISKMDDVDKEDLILGIQNSNDSEDQDEDVQVANTPRNMEAKSKESDLDALNKNEVLTTENVVPKKSDPLEEAALVDESFHKIEVSPNDSAPTEIGPNESKSGLDETTSSSNKIENLGKSEDLRNMSESLDTFDEDDDFSENHQMDIVIQRNMLASSVSEADSDYFEPSPGSNVMQDDFNIKTAFENITSTDTDSTIISAATKIQAGARGFLTRRRMRRSSAGTSASAEHHASFGNAAIDKSMDDLIEQQEQLYLDEAAAKIQKGYRNYRERNLQRKKRDLTMQASTVDLSRDLSDDNSVFCGITDVKVEQKNTSDSSGSGDGSEEADEDNEKSINNIEDNKQLPGFDVNQSEKIDRTDALLVDRAHMSGTTFEELDTAARRLTLQRGDAVQKNSTPEDSRSDERSKNNSSIGQHDTIGSERSSIDVMDDMVGVLKDEQDQSVNIAAAIEPAPVVTRKSTVASEAPIKMERLCKRLERQRSMPVQIESEVFRIIPKHLRTRIQSAGSNKKRIQKFGKPFEPI